MFEYWNEGDPTLNTLSTFGIIFPAAGGVVTVADCGTIAIGLQNTGEFKLNVLPVIDRLTDVASFPLG